MPVVKITDVLENLVSAGEDDWLALWMIAQDVEDELGVDDPSENLAVTVILVKELLKRGFRAGDAPDRNLGPRFKPWANQDPDAVAAFIQREWRQRGELPGWADDPWFAAPQLVQGHG